MSPLAGSTQYQTIVADPPWRYDYRGGPGNAAPWRIGTDDHYPTMTLDEICALPIGGLAAKDAHLYVWAVLPMMERAFAVCRAWGFEPSTMLTWCKPGAGMGRGWRGNTEHLVVARRGRLPFLNSAKGTWYEAPRGRHSAKPDLFLDLIETMSPGPRLELFARNQRAGWDVWGNEVESTVQVA